MAEEETQTSQIKQAVSGNPPAPGAPSKPQVAELDETGQSNTPYHQETPSGVEGMERSMMSQEKAPQKEEAPQENQQYEDYQQYPQYQQQDYAQYPTQDYQSYPQYQDYQQYPQYQAYQGTSGTDTITDLAEQIVSEKLSPVMNKFEKLSDVKTSLQSKMEALDSRLKRIEKIIDTLQISILKKIGEQMTSVSDLKKELHETQKTVKSISKKHHHKKKK